MNRFFRHVLSNKILYAMFGSFALLSAVLLPVMAALLGSAFQRSLRGEAYRAQLTNLQLTSNVMNFRSEDANYLMQTAIQDPDIAQLYYGGTADRDSLRALSTLRMSVRQLHSIYIYNGQTGRVVYSSGMNQYAAASLEAFEDKSFAEVVSNIGQYHRFVPFLRRVTQEKPNGQLIEEYVYTYMLFDTDSSGKAKNVLAFNFYTDWMGDALAEMQTREQDASIWIVSREGQIIYSDTGDLVGTYLDTDLIPAQTLEAPVGYQLVGDGQDRRMVVWAQASNGDFVDWVFLAWVNDSELMAPLQGMQAVIWLVAIVFLAVDLLLIALISGRIYAPVKKTFDKVDSLLEDQQKKREMERYMFLHRLFQGELPEVPSQLEEQLSHHGIPPEMDGEICALLISADHLEAYRRRHHGRMQQADAEMEQAVRQAMDGRFPAYLCVKMQDGQWGLCVPVGSNVLPDWQEQVFEALNHDLGTSEPGLTVSVSVSDVGHNIGDLPYLYAKAVDRMTFRFLLGHRQLITPERTEALATGSYVYPQDSERKLTSALFGGHLPEAQEAYGEFVDAVRGFAVYDIRLAFMLLASALKRAASNTLAEVSCVLLEMDKFYQEFQTLETIEEVNQLFLNLIAEIGEKTQDYALQKHKQIIAKVQEYVAGHYSEITLSMNDVADHVDMSAAYLGRLFKQVQGETFTEFLIDYRLERACELLLQTDRTINDIADAVGFTYSSYFYIVFKKNIGCTPSQYRKQHGVSE